jgi:SAM-dependent methyltransferase
VARCRYRAVQPYIRGHSLVCDIGCGVDAYFLRWIHPHIAWGVGLDHQIGRAGRYSTPIVLADITSGLPVVSGKFDHAVMLAVIEHLANPEAVLREAHRILAPGGSLVITWPSVVIDPLLDVLHWLRVVSSEVETDQHEPRIPLKVLAPMLRGIGFKDLIHRKFELGLNNLIVAFKA